MSVVHVRMPMGDTRGVYLCLCILVRVPPEAEKGFKVNSFIWEVTLENTSREWEWETKDGEHPVKGIIKQVTTSGDQSPRSLESL